MYHIIRTTGFIIRVITPRSVSVVINHTTTIYLSVYVIRILYIRWSYSLCGCYEEGIRQKHNSFVSLIFFSSTWYHFWCTNPAYIQFFYPIYVGFFFFSNTTSEIDIQRKFVSPLPFKNLNNKRRTLTIQVSHMTFMYLNHVFVVLPKAE